MGSSGALQLSTSVGAVPVAPPASLTASAVRLDATNFTLWKGLTLPNLSGAGLHGHLDGTNAAPAKTLKQGAGDDAVDVPNPAYHQWWTVDQRVLGLLLGSMEPDIACQLISCTTVAAVWTAVHTMYGAQSRANIRHLRRQLQMMRKEELTAGQYMHKMKAIADMMATAGAPVSNDELVDYIITGLGKSFNAIAGNLTMGNRSVPYSEFYSGILSFESMQAQQTQDEEWTSQANPHPGLAPTPTIADRVPLTSPLCHMAEGVPLGTPTSRVQGDLITSNLVAIATVGVTSPTARTPVAAVARSSAPNANCATTGGTTLLTAEIASTRTSHATTKTIGVQATPRP
jgi:hypothetical protein